MTVPYDWRSRVEVRRHPRAKYLRLKVHPGGRVELVVPPGTDERLLPTFIEQHHEWVERHLLRIGAAEMPSLPKAINLEAIEQQWQVTYLPALSGPNSCRQSRQGVLQLKADTNEGRRQLLRRWLARQGRRSLVPWLQQTSEELGLPFSGVAIRGQRTRWGSCSSQGRINLNYGLLFLPPDLVRYLFVHELCHTVHLNHSSRYWQLVQQLEPHYKVMEKALRRAVDRIPPWLHHRFED